MMKVIVTIFVHSLIVILELFLLGCWIKIFYLRKKRMNLRQLTKKTKKLYQLTFRINHDQVTPSMELKEFLKDNKEFYINIIANLRYMGIATLFLAYCSIDVFLHADSFISNQSLSNLLTFSLLNIVQSVVWWGKKLDFYRIMDRYI